MNKCHIILLFVCNKGLHERFHEMYADQFISLACTAAEARFKDCFLQSFKYNTQYHKFEP